MAKDPMHAWLQQEDDMLLYAPDASEDQANQDAAVQACRWPDAVCTCPPLTTPDGVMTGHKLGTWRLYQLGTRI